MPGRHGNTSDYRYGFQGQEMDDQIKGEGNSINYKFRMHDPRVGRFFAIDPMTHKYPMLSSYQFNANTPIMAKELEGLESSKDPNPTQNDFPNTSGIQELEEIILTSSNTSPSNYDTRLEDRMYWTSETGMLDINMSYEQWKVKYGKAGESYTDAKKRSKKEWGVYYEQLYTKWKKEAQEERLREKLFLYTVYFYMAEDVMLTYSGGSPLLTQEFKVTSNYFSKNLMRSKTITEILQDYTDDAVKYVDDFGDEAFSPRQLLAIQNKPYLRPMFRGYQIDARVRELVKYDTRVNYLLGKQNKGPDFINSSTGRWWDITTPKAWLNHVRKYGEGGSLLSTKRSLF